MKFIPSEESEEINYKTEKHPWLNALILVVGAIGAYVAFMVFLGVIGETVASKIPPRYESKAFSFMDFKANKKAWPAGQEIVDDIFARNKIDSEFKPEIFISCEDTVNAIALPGKKIIVFDGLVKDIKTLNSLYFVVGHEIGHIFHRDHLRSIGRALAISLGLFFVNMGADTNSFFSFNQAIVDRQFGQGQEDAADDIAIEFTKTRFKGLASSYEFFDNISKKEPNMPRFVNFLSTHPLTQKRIDKIKNHPDHNKDTTTIVTLEPNQHGCSDTEKVDSALKGLDL